MKITLNKAFKSDSQRLAVSLRSSIAKRRSHLNAALCALSYICHVDKYFALPIPVVVGKRTHLFYHQNIMLESFYIIIAILLFFAQIQNGFITALLTAVFWPIVIVGTSMFIFFNMIYQSVKK
ncbi:hypothetical protein ACUSRM_004654 [Vibrio alginolyticus]